MEKCNFLCRHPVGLLFQDMAAMTLSHSKFMDVWFCFGLFFVLKS